MDALHLHTLEKIAPRIGKKAYQHAVSQVAKSPHNLQALQAFQRRKVGGFTISDRVWKVSAQMKNELECAIEACLTEGMSANELARNLKKYLNNPDALYRRVRDKHGNLVLSEKAKNYHPGRGVYRSAHKNALRLAANEINMAYRDSEQLRILQNKDIVGVEICLSPQHTIFDICDELKGKYPKDFIWNQWHIGCKCHRKTILKSDEELIKELNNNEYLPPEASKSYIAQPPKHFNDWVKDNGEKMQRYKAQPAWWTENVGYVKGKTKRERANGIYLLDREKQFLTLFETPNGGKVLAHRLMKKGEDYEEILKAAYAFAHQGKVVELMPEINEKERTIRNLIFPNLQSKTSNPDMRIGNQYYDVKRPSAIKNIEGNANKASKQGAIAIISDSRLDNLTEKIIKTRVNGIFKGKFYTKREVIFLLEGELHHFYRY